MPQMTYSTLEQFGWICDGWFSDLEVLKLMGFIYLNECIHHRSLKEEEVDLVDKMCGVWHGIFFLGFFYFFLVLFPY